MAQLVSIELKPLVKIRNWNRDCITPRSTARLLMVHSVRLRALRRQLLYATCPPGGFSSGPADPHRLSDGVRRVRRLKDGQPGVVDHEAGTGTLALVAL